MLYKEERCACLRQNNGSNVPPLAACAALDPGLQVAMYQPLHLQQPRPCCLAPVHISLCWGQLCDQAILQLTSAPQAGQACVVAVSRLTLLCTALTSTMPARKGKVKDDALLEAGARVCAPRAAVTFLPAAALSTFRLPHCSVLRACCSPSLTIATFLQHPPQHRSECCSSFNPVVQH